MLQIDKFNKKEKIFLRSNKNIKKKWNKEKYHYQEFS